MAGAANAAASVGTGGMRTKLEAARIARSAGCATVIASGLTDRPLAAVLDGARATLIPAPDGRWRRGSRGSRAVSIRPGDWSSTTAPWPPSARARACCPPASRGSRAVSTGATASGSSPPTVSTRAVGLAAFSAEEMTLITGRQTGEIEGLVGYKGPQVAIHRDDLVLEGGA